jgi:hypothetical protein
VVNLLVTESGANFGRAAIIGTKVKTLGQSVRRLRGGQQPRAGQARDAATGASVSDVLMADLKAAYGEDLSDDEPFTVVHLVVLNPEHVGV